MSLKMISRPCFRKMLLIGLLVSQTGKESTCNTETEPDPWVGKDTLEGEHGKPLSILA